jgi:beta-lactamase regulating signal transducer with metallopeptidase domain
MNALFVDSTFAAVVWIVIKATALLGCAAAGQFAMSRRLSAASRHLVWMLALVGILVLPLMRIVLPDWPLPVHTTAAHNAVLDATHAASAPDVPDVRAMPGASANVDVEDAPVPQAAVVSWWAALLTIYAIGMISMFTFVIVQHWRVRRIASRATGVDEDEWRRLLAEAADRMGVRRPVRLLRSRESTMPMTFGTRRPAIMVPAIADTWPDDRRRAVLLHELAHVGRFDCLTHAVACAACAVYWAHPAAWWAARRLRIERELACDDRVIEAGTEARDYAGHLLEIAYLPSGQRAPALAVGMGSQNLEGRMRAALDAARNRSVPGLRARVLGMAIAALVLAAVASARPTVVVSATEPPREIAPAAFSSSGQPSGQQSAVVAPHLKAVEWPFPNIARRVVNAVNAVLGIAQQILPGTWELRPGRTPDVVNLRLNEAGSSFSSNVPLEQLQGLTAAQLSGPGGPIAFQMRRDAGTFSFEGMLRGGVAAGTYTFTADPAFPGELAKRGFARPTAREQYELARHDVGFALIDELNRQGYTKPQTSELVQAGQHGVREDFVREMGALGYRLGDIQALITLRDHGVTPAYVRELGEQGYKGLSADALRNARDHGISPDYVRGMRDAGYGALPLDELINARDHGVGPEFVKELGDAGYRKLSLEQVIGVRDHGVSPEFVRELRQLGHTLPLNELVNARDHGVDPAFVREMAALGYRSLSMDELIRLRDHGVSPTYVRELRALGYDQISAEDLRMLRDHGVTPDRIRAANARAGTRLPIDMLKALVSGGMQ